MNEENRPLVKKASRVVLLGIAMLFMATQYTNCGQYQAMNSQLDGASSVACTTTNCILESTDNLKVTPHLPNGDYSVPAGLKEFNLGGDCNEGGFANNYIHWDLVDNSGNIVRNSGMQIAQGLTAESRCVNGRFLIYVLLSPITLNNADPYDRTGLMIPGGSRAAYNLRITIFGSSATTSTQGQYQTNVPLNAI